MAMSGSIYRWQYNGVASFAEIVKWCHEQFGLVHTNNFDTIYFATEEKYAFFLLRWS